MNLTNCIPVNNKMFKGLESILEAKNKHYSVDMHMLTYTCVHVHVTPCTVSGHQVCVTQAAVNCGLARWSARILVFVTPRGGLVVDAM